MKDTLPLITLILALSSFHLDAKPVKAKDIDRQFLAPEMQYRPYVRWWWNGDRVEPQEIIREHSKTFGGSLSDAECIKLIGIARGTYYKYKREIKNL